MVVSAFTCCKKDDEKNYPSEIIIGDDTPTTPLAPQLILNFFSRDTIGLDLNNDGSFDLVFAMLPIPLTSGYGSAYFVGPKKHVKIIVSNREMPDTLNPGHVINLQSKWNSNSEDKYLLTTFKRNSHKDFEAYGNWLAVSDKYLGFMIDSIRFGWVKMDCKQGDKLVIKEFAISQKE